MRKGLMILLAFLALAWAQAPVRPELSLNAFRFNEGEALELEGRGLEPDTTYQLLLTRPDGEESREALSSDENGELEFSSRLNETGDWQIALSGEEVDAQFRFEVAPDVSAAGAQGSEADTAEETPADARSPELFQDSPDDETSPTDLPNDTGNEGGLEQDEANTPDRFEADAPTALDPQTQPATDSLEADSGLSDTEPTDNLPDALDADTAADDSDLAPAPGTDALDTQDALDIDAADTDTTDALDTADTDATVTDTAVTDVTDETRDFTTGIESVFSGIARVGWYAVGALLLAMLALHITLLFKYWIPQSVILRRRAAQRGTPSTPVPVARLLAIRFYSFTEKLVLVIMFAVTMLLAALAGWNNPSQPFATWQDAVVATFSNPWVGLRADKPDGFSEILWMGLIVLFLAWLVFVVFWLFIPRPRLAKNAPRSPLYNVFSVLVPGSGLADEMWGLLLIVPWALVGLDTLSNLLGWGIGIPALRLSSDYIFLSLIYLINLVAVAFEFSSYRRRMEKLEQDNPELAEEFGVVR